MRLFFNSAVLLTSIALVQFSAVAETVTNFILPGIVCISETRTNPPERLFIAQVDLKNPRLHLRVSPGGPDPDGPGGWQTVLLEPTRIAEHEKLDFVVNGDFFVAKGVNDGKGTNAHFRAGQWATVAGPATTDGKNWSRCTNTQPCLVVRKNGTVKIESVTELDAKNREVISGGPLLVKDGVAVTFPDKVPLSHKGKTRQPRTVVGIDATGTKLTILVVDGRKPGVASGMSYKELAAEMVRLGCKEAMNLDGGGSSLMAVRDTTTGKMKILNQPADGSERAVANVLGISCER